MPLREVLNKLGTGRRKVWHVMYLNEWLGSFFAAWIALEKRRLLAGQTPIPAGG